nr:hypothetical protein [Halomonas alkaliphila]
MAQANQIAQNVLSLLG